MTLWAAGLSGQPLPRKAEPAVHRGARAEGGHHPATLQRMARPSREFSLGRLRAGEATPVNRKPGLTAIGTSRELPADLPASGEWSSTPEGRPVWRLSVRSEGAQALRVRFSDFHAGAGRVWLLAADEEGMPISAGPYSGDGPHGDGEFWSDMLTAESVVVAYEPAADSPQEVPFKLTRLSHRFAPTKAASLKNAAGIRSAAASCTVDSVCRPEHSEPASAVALIIFESGGETYQCSGALVTSSSQPVLPFFLTANHCIATADEAKSVIAFFNYQTPTCNGTPPSLGRSPRVTGSTFVAGGGISSGDYTLLQLSGFPAVDVKLLGWRSEEIAANQQVMSISHPAGDYKRIALGERTRDATIRYSDGERMPANRGYQVTWFEGVTQGGSSGSPLLAIIEGKPYLAGTLSGGPEVEEDDDAQICRTNNLIASYGRFSAAFPALQPFLTALDGGSRPVPGVARASLTATPLAGTAAAGVTTLAWQAPGYARVQIRVGSADGVAMTGVESSEGTVQSGPWATEGLTFYLQDGSNGDSSGAAKTLAVARVQRTASQVRPTGTITLSPAFSFVGPGQTAVTTTVTWQASGVSRVQIRVDSPSGTPMTGLEAAEGSATTGDWVTDGTAFYLQDASDGNSSGGAKTIAIVRARVLQR